MSTLNFVWPYAGAPARSPTSSVAPLMVAGDCQQPGVHTARQSRHTCGPAPPGTRKGHVEFFTKQYDKALETYQAGLAKDPENEELKDGLRRTMIEIQRGQTGQVDEAEMKEYKAKGKAAEESDEVPGLFFRRPAAPYPSLERVRL